MTMQETPIGANNRDDIPPDLMVESDLFLQAGRRYREYLKRKHRDRLGGVVLVESDHGEMVLYSESEVFTERIKATKIPSLSSQPGA